MSSWAPLMFSVQEGPVRYNVEIQKLRFACYEARVRFLPPRIVGSTYPPPRLDLCKQSRLFGPCDPMSFTRRGAKRKAERMIVIYSGKRRSRLRSLPVSVRAARVN
jgi:hypothetical protein